MIGSGWAQPKHSQTQLDVCRGMKRSMVARMLYASPVWWGFIDAGSRNEIKAVVRRLIRLNYLPSEFGLFEEMCRKANTVLFSAVLND